MTESLDHRAHADKMFEQRYEQMAALPGQILFALSCNDAAEYRWRKAAVELLIDKKFSQATAPELANFVREITADRAAKSDVEDLVETAIEAPLAESSAQLNFGKFEAHASGGRPRVVDEITAENAVI